MNRATIATVGKTETESDREVKALENARASLWREREVVQGIVRDIDAAIKGIDRKLGKGGPRGRPRDQIVAHLLKKEIPVEFEALVEELFDIGVCYQSGDPRKAIRTAITVNSKNVDDPPLKIVVQGDQELVGLSEWGEEKFLEKGS